VAGPVGEAEWPGPALGTGRQGAVGEPLGFLTAEVPDPDPDPVFEAGVDAGAAVLDPSEPELEPDELSLEPDEPSVLDPDDEPEDDSDDDPDDSEDDSELEPLDSDDDLPRLSVL